MSKETGNDLFPVFLKLEDRKVLIVGGGNVALEKLNTLLQNSSMVNIIIVADVISDKIRNIALNHSNIRLIERRYESADLDAIDFVIAAVGSQETSSVIRQDARQKGKLINVADKPGLCDFYMGAIVKKGNLKIAISTNGKSPTIAKRLKELLNEALPHELNQLLVNMQTIRNRLNGDFASKVNTLNRITEELISKETEKR